MRCDRLSPAAKPDELLFPNRTRVGELMRILLLVAIAMTNISSAAANAGASCPPHQGGAPYPWSSNELMTGDKWAEVELDVDATGTATSCRVVKSNMSREDNFGVCGAMQVQGQYDPPMKDGTLIAGKVQTKMLLEGMRHRDADMAARKRWFREHPQERWACYPE